MPTTPALLMETAETWLRERVTQEGLAESSAKRMLSQIRAMATTIECLDAKCTAGCIKVKRGTSRVHFGDTVPLDSYDTETIKRYFMAATLGVSGRRQSVSTLKIFGEWLMDEGLIAAQRNPTNKIKTPRQKDDTQGAFLDPQDLSKVLEVAGRYHSRDFFMILIAWLSGRRISEIHKLTIGSVDRSRGRIKWRDYKGKQDNLTLELHELLDLAVTAWLEKYEELIGQPLKDDWYLFPAGSPLGRAVKGQHRGIRLVPTDYVASPNYIIHRHLEAAGLYVKGTAWHALRRGMGDRIVELADALGRGDGMELAQKLLNHKKRETTERHYIRRRNGRKLAGFFDDVGADLLPAEVRAQIPAFAHLADKPEGTTSDALATPQGDAQVISLMDRRKRAG